MSDSVRLVSDSVVPSPAPFQVEEKLVTCRGRYAFNYDKKGPKSTIMLLKAFRDTEKGFEIDIEILTWPEHRAEPIFLSNDPTNRDARRARNPDMATVLSGTALGGPKNGRK